MVNTAILFAKIVGSRRLTIAVKGGVVMVTEGTVMVTGALANLKLGSTRIGDAAIRGSTGNPKYPIG